MAGFSNGLWSQVPPVTKNLLLINFAVWVFDAFAQRFGVDIIAWLGLVNWSASAFQGVYSFHIWQPFTYMFLHANFWHFFCNMFAVIMFGPAIENQWGSKKFLTYYLVSGVGAAIVQELVWMFSLGSAMGVTIGASGAVFGILFAFGWLFPEVKMFLLFIPIPIPSRWFVALYAIFELSAGIYGATGDNVAHFAHLGGMLFGWLLLLYWMKAPHIRFGKKKEEKPLFTRYHYQAPVNDQEDSNEAAESYKTSQPTSSRDAEVDRLLDKIKREGYSSLTQEEKDRLFKH